VDGIVLGSCLVACCSRLLTVLYLRISRLIDVDCSLCILVRRSEHLIGRHCGNSRQTEVSFNW
jgi:hypothetical protein